MATKVQEPKITWTGFGLMEGTTREVYVKWSFNRKNVDHYEVDWDYYTPTTKWMTGTDSNVNSTDSTYTAPEEAIKVRVRVKAVSKKHKENGKDVPYWTHSYTGYKKTTYNFVNNPPLTPSAPSVKIEGNTLTATVENIQSNINADYICFELTMDDASVIASNLAPISTSTSSYAWAVNLGNRYKVRCCAYRSSDDEYGEWSDYSSNTETSPNVPGTIIDLHALSSTSVYIAWSGSSNAESYEIQYTTKLYYFDSSSEVKSVTVNKVVTHAEITGIETGNEYFFRVRAANNQGNSGWTNVASIILGRDPGPPTTWSSTTTCIVGEELILYWVHNSEDGSSQVFAELELNVNGVVTKETIWNTTDEDEKDKTSFKIINTSSYTEGVKIKWRVRTAGVTNILGDWSIERTIDIYARPTLQLKIMDSTDLPISVLQSFPLKVKALAGPNTQAPIGYHLSISANSAYESTDEFGNSKIVNKDEAVYAKYFDIKDDLSVVISAGDVDLETDITYTVHCIVAMNSGLTATSSAMFSVYWEDKTFLVDAEIGADLDTLTTFIKANCTDDDGNYPEDIELAIYRREFDGKFTKIASGIKNNSDTWVTDPHPSLDYAKYRIVTTYLPTGSIGYYDLPGYPIGESSVVIQWDEQWSDMNGESEDERVSKNWSGTMLKLPYNVDISDKTSIDVSHVKYIGREHPVTYYGTQVGQTSSWKVAIDAEDSKTLYALRRLSVWMGDVYVREPSGTGYWASVSVSFSRTHCELTIPVSIEVTRVEGGM